MNAQPRHKILVADDDTRGLHFLRELLSNEGYELSCACDGPEALLLAEESSPDVILLDVMMPGMDGFEVCRRLRVHPRLSQIPIILLTALDDRESKLEGLEAGADDFLTKPFDATELLVRLRTIARLNRFRKLSEERARFEQIVAYSPHGIVIVDEQGRILLANREFARIGSLAEANEAQGQSIYDWLVGQGSELTQNHILQVKNHGKTYPVEVLISGCPDSDAVTVELTCSAIPWEGSMAYQLVLNDVQERKRLETQVMRFQRIELLGEMAGSIVHDMNNVLSAISGNLGILEMGNELQPESKGRIATIQQSVQRGTNILRQLLAFTRGSDGALTPLNLEEVVDEVLELLTPMMKYDYKMSKALEGAIPIIEADPNQLHQVFMNLCVNARDAMPEGGALKLTVFPRTITASEAPEIAPDAAPGTYACVSVADSGTGMSAAVRERIFAPFFTTKPPGKGTGLGLATVLRLVRRHKGFISIASEVGKGTTFTCHFPAAS